MRTFCLPLFGITLALGLVANTSLAADALDKKLLEQAPGIWSKLREKEYRNVGVLKFRVKIGDQPATDRAGVLNQRLSDKLELALILTNKISDPVGVIRNANQTAAGIPGATHLTAEGRKLLFGGEYPLAWGDQRVVPDAFLTGVVVIGGDLRAMTVGILMFDRESATFEQMSQFEAPIDLEDLLDSGESFSVRGVFDSASMQLSQEERKERATTEAIKTSLAVREETATQSTPATSRVHPLSPSHPDSPVSLEVRYDNKVQAIEFRNGAAFLPEPSEGQKVSLIVRRKGAARPRLGVVIKVNGENTLYRQKLPDAQCAAWVLEPHLVEFGITGFQIDAKTEQAFRVLSQAESKSREIDYGEFVGTISISVFPEQTTPAKPNTELLLSDDGEDFNILKRSAFPEKTPNNLGALRQQLAQASTRGLIAEGEAVERDVQVVKFKHDPLPLMSGSIKYYNPQDLPE